jgi:hypothetical protein
MVQYLRPILRVCQIIFTIFLVFFALRSACYHFTLVTFPYPCALREGAMMTNTDALAKGINPYDMSRQPQLMNPYGIVYPLLVWPWAKLFGTTILIHRTVTAFFILATCILIFFVLRRLKVSVLLSIWAVLMLYSSLMFPGTSTPTIDPGSTGMFLLLLTIFIPWFCRYSYRSLIISLLIGILAFYTKPYAFLGTLIMSSYLFLFVSKIKSFFYGSLLLILSAVSVVAVNQILPAYFDNCFFTSLNMTSSWSSVERLYLQIHLYSALHIWTLVLIGICLLVKFYKSRALHDFSGIALVLWAGMWSAFVLYFSLGRHSGAMLWYFFQLLSPFLLVGAAWIFNRHALWPIWCVPFLILNLFTMTANQDYKIFNNSTVGWPELTQVMGQYQHILNSPLIVPILVEQNKEFFDNGQSEYFLSGSQRNGLMKTLFKEDYRGYTQMLLFFRDIRNRVENKEFDLIILQPSLMPLGIGDDIKEYYKFEGQLILFAPQDLKPYAVTIWIRSP